MAHLLHRTVPTRWSADEVFDYLLDFAHAAEWDSGTVRCERVSGDGEVGTRYHNVSRFLGRETHLEYQTEQVDPARRRFTVAGGNKTVTSRDTVTVTERTEGGSVVDYRAELTFHGPARVISPLLTPFLTRLGDNTAAQLQRVLDAKADA